MHDPQPFGWQHKAMKTGRKYQKEVLWLEHTEGSGHIYYPGPVQERRAGVLELVGQWDRAEHIWRRCLEHARAGGRPEEIARAILNLCKLLQRRGRYAEAEALSQEAGEIAIKVGDRRLLGQSLASLGLVRWRQGDQEKAQTLLFEALELYRQADFSEGMSAALNNLGVIMEGRGEYAKAMECYQRKRAIDEAAGNKRGLANILNNLGVCLLHQGNLQKAEEMFLEKLSLEQAMGNKAGVAAALSNLAIIYRQRKEQQRAIDICLRTVDICREIGDRRVEGIATNNLGNIYKEQGQYHKAIDCYLAALWVAESQGDRKDIAIYSGNIGQIYHYWLEEPEKALAHYDRTVNILSDMDQPYHLCEYMLFRCQLLLEMGQEEGLEDDVRRIEQAAERSGRNEIMYQAEVLRSRLEAKTDRQTALARLEGLTKLEAEPVLKAEALFWTAMISQDPGHRDRAIEVIESVKNSMENPEAQRWLKRLKERAGRAPMPGAG
jgi:tetratricopeptide (TPR) repeat protein